MKPNPTPGPLTRLDRLQRECTVSAAPAMLLAATVAALALWLPAQSPLNDNRAERAVEPVLQIPPPLPEPRKESP